MVFLSVLLGGGGCATMPQPPSPEIREELGRIGIVALPSSPQGDFQTFAKGPMVGAAKGSAIGSFEGVLYGLAEATRGSGGNPYAVAVMLIAALVFGLVGSVVYGIEGAAKAVGTKAADEIKTQIHQILQDMDLGGTLANTIHSAAVSRPELEQRGLANLGSLEPDARRSYDEFSKDGFNTVLEVSVTAVGFEGGAGKDPLIRLYMNASVNLVDAATGTRRYRRDFRYSSRQRPFEAWFADGAEKLRMGFDVAMRGLADRILDELFLVTRFPFESGLRAFPGQPEFGACWFRPIHPELKYTSLWSSIRQAIPGVGIVYSQVDSTSPTFEWEPFPRPRDRVPKNDALIRKITDVTYDLKIWKAEGDAPERLVYDCTGLMEPRYRVEDPLEPHTKYFWTVRARYKLDGKAQVTRWAFSLVPSVGEGMPPGGSCDLENIPSANFYRFRTP